MPSMRAVCRTRTPRGNSSCGRRAARRFVVAEASARPNEVDEAVVALREAAADVGVELLVLRVHAVGAEAFAELDHRARAGVIEQRLDDHDNPLPRPRRLVTST